MSLYDTKNLVYFSSKTDKGKALMREKEDEFLSFRSL